MSTSNFWLIRHGETKWNAGMRLQGWRDIALSETGIEQARHLARHLSSPGFTERIDAIISSDLSRAHETATIAAGHFGHPVVVTPTLRERNFGIYEGQLLIMQENGRAGVADFDLRCPHTPVEQGETLTDFAQRVQDAFETLAAKYAGRNVMVFAHGGVIDIAWRHAQQLGLDAFRAEPIMNTSINQFSIDADRSWSMLNWGQIHHLTQSDSDRLAG